MKKYQLTQTGFDQLTKELKELTEVKRPNAVDLLQKARSMGDLSENSGYHAAKEELAMIEGRILEIEEVLKNVEIVNKNSDTSTVTLGDQVKVSFNNKENIFLLVGEYEADPMNRKISVTSPLGQKLLGKKVGDQVEIDAPSGKVIYTIIEIK